MSEQATREAPTVLTQRLVFDDDEIPAFLRKDHPGSKPAKIEEPVGAPLIEEPANENVAVVDETPAAQEAPAEVASEVQAPAVECHGTTDGDGSDEPTIEDLQRQQQEIDRKIQEKREAEKRSVIEQIVSVVNTYKIPVEELVEALGGMKVKRKGVKAKPKYKDPATGQIWSGRGKEPAWIKGKDRKPFEL